MNIFETALIKEIIACICMTFGFGSDKKVNRFDFYEWSSLDFNIHGLVDAYFSLVENGYISEHETPRVPFLWGNIGGDKYIGISEKGWIWAIENNFDLEAWEKED